jgi:transposase InsO family protein
LKAYKEKGFEGLLPAHSGRPGRRVISEDILNEAILLRRQCPTRSVKKIIAVLESENKVLPGSVKRSTLQEQLVKMGYSSTLIKEYATQSAELNSLRFQRKHRNELWQSDIKYGPYIGNQRTYLVAFIDDSTRFITHSQFYFAQTLESVEDCFKKGLTKCGIPKGIYLDNGKPYRAHVLGDACLVLGIKALYCKPYSARSKGKIERFNGTVNSFIDELQLEKVDSLEELNRKWNAWLDVCYQTTEHAALKDNKFGKTPEAAFMNDSAELRFVDQETIHNAFLRVEPRKVDKTGCVNFDNKKWTFDGSLNNLLRKVQVVWDNAAIDKPFIKVEGLPLIPAKQLVIEERVGKRPQMPPALKLAPTDHSRVLAMATHEHEIRQQAKASMLFDANQNNDAEPSQENHDAQPLENNMEKTVSESKTVRRPAMSFTAWKKNQEEQ